MNKDLQLLHSFAVISFHFIAAVSISSMLSCNCFLIYLILPSCSYAGAIFADACLKGLNGVPDVVECSFVQSTVTELPFFASKVINLTDNVN